MAEENRDERLLFEPFRQRLTQGLAVARIHGIEAYIFEGWRPASRQTELYAQGRTTPGKVVTDAKAWESWHQYGVAADVVFGGPGKWTWEGPYEDLGPILEAQGLEWAGRWQRFKELPHFQWTAGMSLEKAKVMLMSRGLLGVWEALAAAQVPVA